MRKKYNYVHIIDQTSEGDHHMVFNASLIKIMKIINDDSQLIYYGTKSDVKSVITLLNKEEIDKIKFRTINYKFKPKSTFSKILNYGLKELQRLFHFLKIFSKSSSNDLIVLSITTFTCFLGFKIIKLFFNTPTIAVLHGDVDYVYNANGLYGKLNGFVHRLIFKLKDENFNYLVLNKIEKKLLVNDGYLKSKEIYEIEHPFLNMKENEELKILSKAPLKFGHIGSMELERKNSHFIFELAEKSRDLIQDKKIVFRSVGLMTPAIKPFKNNLVEMIVGNESEDSPRYLTRDQYEKELSNLDYILFFYPEQEYVFRASGAVVDFLAKNIPIICLRHPLFEYMFDKAGNIGFMCENLDEIGYLIKKITSPEFNLEKTYNEQVENIKNYSNKFSVKNVAKDLKEQMN